MERLDSSGKPKIGQRVREFVQQILIGDPPAKYGLSGEYPSECCYRADRISSWSAPDSGLPFGEVIAALDRIEVDLALDGLAQLVAPEE